MPERLPPSSPEAERGVLGAILNDPGVYPDAAERVRTDWFYDLRHQEIWAAMTDLGEKGEVDLISLMNRLRERGKLEAVGGLAYLNELMNEVPSSANLPRYLDILAEHLRSRRLLQAVARASAGIYDPEASREAVIARAQAEILEITSQTGAEKEQHLRELMPAVIDVLERFAQGHKVMSGYPTGFNYLDNMMAGWEGANMYVIAGRPSSGKTSLVVDFLLHFAQHNGPCAFFSMEMTKMQVALRILASTAAMDFKKFRNGFLAEGEPLRLVEAAGNVAATNLYVDDSSGLNGQEIMMRTRRMIRQHGIKLIAIDYLQLMGSVERYREKRDRVAEASEWCKKIARQLNIPVIVLAQLNREIEKGRTERAPTLSDLAESGDIEQDADFVGALYRPKLDTDWLNPERVTLRQAQGQFKACSDPNILREWYWLKNLKTHNEEDLDEPLSKSVRFVNLVVAKQRNGPTGDVGLVYYVKQMRFADAWKG